MMVYRQIIRKKLLIGSLCGVLALAACVDEPGGMLGSGNIKVVKLTAQTLPNAPVSPVASKAKKVSAPSQKTFSYKIGVGDVLKISMYTFKSDGEIQGIYPSGDYDSSNGAISVGKDGVISLPYVGDVMMLGRTQAEIRDTITSGLKKYFKRAQVDVRIIEYNSQRVVVTGEVATPGEQKLTVAELRVIAALAAAGGVTPQADLENAEIRRADGSVEAVDLMALYNRGDQSQNAVLQSGDTIYVPQNHRNKVFLAGEVVKPQSLPIPKGRLTLTEALMEAGGLEKVTAARSNIYVIRGGVGDLATQPPAAGSQEKIAQEQAALHATVYQISMEAPESYVLADQFALAPRDVVYVSARAITEWDRFISQLIPGSVQSILYGAMFNN